MDDSRRMNNSRRSPFGASGRSGPRQIGIEALEERQLLSVRPLDAEVEPLVPSASLAYVAEAQETLHLANEIESFTLDLDAAQSVSLLAEPEQGLDVRIELFDPDGETLATTDEQGPGGSEWINWLPIGNAGKYRVDVQLVAGEGDFAFQWLVNAGTELENVSGLNNDTPQLAEDVSAGWLPWIDQETGLSHETLTIRGDRAAEETILFSTSFEDPSLVRFNNSFGSGGGQWHISTRRGRDPGHSGPNSLYFGDSITGTYADAVEGVASLPAIDLSDADGRVELSFAYLLDIEQGFELAAVEVVSDSGVVTLADTLDLNNLRVTPEGFTNETFDLTPFVGERISIRFRFLSDDFINAEGWYIDDVVVRQLSAPADDNYALELSAGDVVSLLALSDAGIGPGLSLLGDETQVLAQGIMGQGERSQGIHELIIPRDSRYVVNITGESGPYSVFITRGSDIEPDKNGKKTGEPHSLHETLQVIGAIEAPATPISQEQEPNNDGNFFGDILDDLPFANDLRGSFARTSDGVFLASIDGEIVIDDIFQPDVDFFRFTATPDTNLVASIEGLTLPDPFLTLYDKNGNELAVDDDGGEGTDPRLEYDSFSYAGDYFLAVEAFDFESGSYTANIVLETSGELPSLNADQYVFSAEAGDELRVDLVLPYEDTEHPGLPSNGLSAVVRLFGSSGELLAEQVGDVLNGGRVLIEQTTAESGLHRIEIVSADGRTGTYVLRVAGATKAVGQFAVESLNPSAGSYLAVAPDYIDILFTSGIRLDTLTDSDLLIDGTPAENMEILAGDRVRFIFPQLPEGPHDFTILEGSILDWRSNPIQSLETALIVDLTGPRLIATNVAEGETLAAGEVTLEFTFDEPLLVSQLDLNDIQVVGQLSGLHKPTSLDYDEQTNMVSLRFDSLPDDAYRLTLLSNDGGFEDLAGNDLDGETTDPVTLPSGDGTPGGDYIVSFTADVVSLNIDSVLTPVSESLGLLYQGNFQGTLGNDSDEDRFTLNLESGQTLGVTIYSDEGGRIALSILAPDGSILASASNEIAGDPVTIASVQGDLPGAYTLAITGISNRTSYQGEVLINGQFEQESVTAESNNTPDSAETLAAPVAELVSGASWNALLGRREAESRILLAEDFENGLGGFTLHNSFGLGDGQWHLSTGRGSQDNHSATQSLYFGQGESNTGGGIYANSVEGAVLSPLVLMPTNVDTIDLSFQYFAEIEDSFDVIRVEVISESQVDILADNAVTGGLLSQTSGFQTARIDLTNYAGKAIQIRFTMSTDSSVTFEGWYIDDVQIASQDPVEDDFFYVGLTQNETVTFLLDSLSGDTPLLELFSPGGVRLAVGRTDSANVEQLIAGFATPETGEYLLRVSDGLGDYALAVLRGATLERERNDDLSSAMPIGPSSVVLGRIPRPSSDLAEPLVEEGNGAEDTTPSKQDVKVPNRQSLLRLASANAKSKSDDLPQFAPDRLIVGFDDGTTSLQREQTVQQQGYLVINDLKLVNAIVVALPSKSENISREIAKWLKLPGVKYAEPDYIVQASDLVPNDTRFDELYALNNTGQTSGEVGADINALAAWELFQGTRDVVVASIDTGVDYTHEDLADNIWVNPGEIPGDGIDNDGNGFIDDIHGIDTVNNDSDPLDDNGHGTHTAGTIGAVGNNGLGITGVNWNVQIMALKFLSATGNGFTSDAVRSIEYVVTMARDYGINVVASNNSWGGGGFSQSLEAAISEGVDAGILFVAAAGNSSTNTDLFPSYPASYDIEGIISVAATDNRDQVAWFSNRGENSVDLAAPGQDILSTLPGNAYGVLSGTSMAAPHVTGVAALLAGLAPELSALEIKQALLEGVTPLPQLDGVVSSGGRLDALGALAPFAEPSDWYRLAVAANEEIMISTLTPGDRVGGIENSLDPVLELYEANGNLIASNADGASDGRNAQLTYSAESNKDIFIRVLGSSGRGSYLLQIEATDTQSIPFEVDTVSPGNSQRLAATPESVLLQFNDGILLDSIQKEDLLFNGLPATGIEIIDGNRVRFLVPNLEDGLVSVDIAAGAVSDLQGTPLESFHTEITIDTTAPRVVAVSMEKNTIVPAGELSLTIEFDEQLLEENLGIEDVLLNGTLSGNQFPTFFEYDSQNSILSLRFENLVDDQYELHLLSGDGRFEDLVGWNLDGESLDTAPGDALSGDGSPGGDFRIEFVADVDVATLPTEFTAAQPLGSLVYSGVAGAFTIPAGDKDEFTVELDAGQSLVIALTPDKTLLPQLEVLAPDGTVLSTNSGAFAGESLVTPSLTVSESGVYQLRVTGLGETTGGYRVEVFLNSLVELEGIIDSNNDSFESAQQLDSGWIALNDTSRRLALLGSQQFVTQVLFSEDFEQGLGGFTIDNTGGGGWHLSRGREFDQGHSSINSLYFGENESSSGNGLYKSNSHGLVTSPSIDLSGVSGKVDLSFNYFLDIEDFYDTAQVDVLVEGGQTVTIADNNAFGNLSDSTGQFRKVNLDLSEFAGKKIQLQFRVTTDESVELEGWYVDDILVQSRVEAKADYYRLNLKQGTQVSFGIEQSGNNNIELELIDAERTVLANGVSGNTPFGKTVSQFDIPQSGSYFIRVLGGETDYVLVAGENVSFEQGRNDSLEVAQPLGDSLSVLGYVSESRDRSGKVPKIESNTKPREIVSNVNANQNADRQLIVSSESPLALAMGIKYSETGDVRLVSQLPLINGFVIETDGKLPLENIAQAWNDLPGVNYVEPIYNLTINETIPNDPNFSQLYGLQNTGQTGGLVGADISAPFAWDLFTGSRDVVIASIDTGVDYRHEDLAANMWVNPGEIPDDGIDNDGNGYVDDIFGIDTINGDSDPFDDNGHGTHTSGTMAAVGNNGIGVTGINWNASVMALKFLDASGSGTTAAAIEAIQYMTLMREQFGVNIVVSNNSWGGGDNSFALRDAIQRSIDAGILFVAAAGNSGQNTDSNPSFPASFDLPGIISVAATNPDDRLASFSNFGATSVDIGAPGVNILSTTPGNTYSSFSGTSMASPHVAGAAALLAGLSPGITPEEIKSILLESVDVVNDLQGRTVSQGRLNLATALAQVGSPDDWYSFEAAENQHIVVQATLPGGGPFAFNNALDPIIQLYDPAGNLISTNDNSSENTLESRIGYVTQTAGLYKVRLFSASGDGEYLLNVNKSDFVPPEVAAVEVSSSTWGEQFHAQLTADGFGPSGVQLTSGPSEQPQPLPWSNLDELHITLNQPVKIELTDLTLRNQDGTELPIDVLEFGFDPLTNTAFWRFDQPLPSGLLIAQLSDSVKSIETGIALDGEWRDQLSYFPSGDGKQGGVFETSLNTIQADFDGDSSVGLADFQIFKDSFGLQDPLLDLNGSGQVDLPDFSLFKSAFGAAEVIDIQTTSDDTISGSSFASMLTPVEFGDLSSMKIERASLLALPNGFTTIANLPRESSLARENTVPFRQLAQSSLEGTTPPQRIRERDTIFASLGAFGDAVSSRDISYHLRHQPGDDVEDFMSDLFDDWV